MKRIMVDMSATIIHHGHIRLLKKAKEYGKVIVGLTSDEEILNKKGYIPELKFEYRKEILESIKYVDEVVVTPWLLTNETLEKYNIDLLVHGSDNSNEIDEDKLLVFPRTEGISSTDIRKRACEIIRVKENNSFDIWNEIKKEVDNINKRILFEERDIVFLKMGKNVGFEEDGKGKEFLRPVLIYKKFNANQFIAFAMTSQKPKEKNMKYYYKLKENSYIILSQIRTYSAKRIKYNSHKINKRHFQEISSSFNKIFTPSILKGDPNVGICGENYNKDIRKSQMKIKRNILLNPGPATTTDSVKLAQVVPDICPREKEFGDIMEYISNELTSFVADNENYTTILFGGSGTAVIEAVISSVIDKNKNFLIVNNGAYGKRMTQIASRYKIDFVEFKSSSIEPIDINELEKTIKENNIDYLAVVHHETTTGLLNNLDKIGELSKKYNFDLIVDAISSFAAIPIDMKKQNISYLCASSNKNIQGMAGVGFVIANKEKLESLKDIEPRSFYLSLYEQYQNFIKTHQMRFTPPVQTLYALKQAIIETKKEGIENRYKRYSKSWETLINGLKKLGLKYLVEDKYHSKIITSIFIPDGVDFDEMHDYFYEKGFTIYPGKVEEFNTFRIANIGDIDYRDIEEFLKLLEEYLK